MKSRKVDKITSKAAQQIYNLTEREDMEQAFAEAAEHFKMLEQDARKDTLHMNNHLN